MFLGRGHRPIDVVRNDLRKLILSISALGCKCGQGWPEEALFEYFRALAADVARSGLKRSFGALVADVGRSRLRSSS